MTQNLEHLVRHQARYIEQQVGTEAGGDNSLEVTSRAPAVGDAHGRLRVLPRHRDQQRGQRERRTRTGMEHDRQPVIVGDAEDPLSPLAHRVEPGELRLYLEGAQPPRFHAPPDLIAKAVIGLVKVWGHRAGETVGPGPDRRDNDIVLAPLVPDNRDRGSATGGRCPCDPCGAACPRQWLRGRCGEPARDCYLNRKQKSRRS